jgi:hypothetical protein
MQASERMEKIEFAIRGRKPHGHMLMYMDLVLQMELMVGLNAN